MRFTEQESNLICRVLSQSKGAIGQVTKVFAIRQNIWTNRDKEFDISKEDLNIVASIVMGYNQYMIDDVPVLATITQAFSNSLIAKQEAADVQKQEETADGKSGT